jgi:hypothetical protein
MTTRQKVFAAILGLYLLFGRIRCDRFHCLGSRLLALQETPGEAQQNTHLDHHVGYVENARPKRDLDKVKNLSRCHPIYEVAERPANQEG